MSDDLFILGGIISLVFLITFWVLCGNIAYIKKYLKLKENPLYWLAEYNKHKYLVNDAQAKTALQNYIWYALIEYKSKKNYETLKDKYQSIFEGYNIKFPEWPFK